MRAAGDGAESEDTQSVKDAIAQNGLPGGRAFYSSGVELTNLAQDALHWKLVSLRCRAVECQFMRAECLERERRSPGAQRRNAGADEKQLISGTSSLFCLVGMEFCGSRLHCNFLR